MNVRDLVIRLVINAVAVSATAWLLPGITFEGQFGDLVIAALVVVLVNTFIAPIITLLSLPFIACTLGLFIFVINALMLMLIGRLVPGLTIDNFWWAVFGAIVMGIVSSIMAGLLDADESPRRA